VIRALAFLTILGRSAPPDPSTLRWFPFAGALIGAMVGGLWCVARTVMAVALRGVPYAREGGGLVVVAAPAGGGRGPGGGPTGWRATTGAAPGCPVRSGDG
jgi:hypothetical protein